MGIMESIEPRYMRTTPPPPVKKMNMREHQKIVFFTSTGMYSTSTFKLILEEGKQYNFRKVGGGGGVRYIFVCKI